MYEDKIPSGAGRILGAARGYSESCLGGMRPANEMAEMAMAQQAQKVSHLPPLARAVDLVEGSITILLTELDDLERKLQPVLIAAPPQTTNGSGNSAVPDNNSPIGYHLQEQAQRLRVAIGRVRDLVERVSA